MKEFLLMLMIGSLMLLTGWALARDKEPCLRKQIDLEGVVDHVQTGQIFLRTPEGQMMQWPHLATSYSLDASVTLATLRPGQTVRIRLPGSLMRPGLQVNGVTQVDSYLGTFYIPTQEVETWWEGPRSAAR